MTRRRAYGTGSIQKIRDDYWRIVAPAGKDPATGKRRRIVRYVRGTRRQAEIELANLLTKANEGQLPTAPARYTVAELLDEWYEEMAPNWSHNTRRTRDADVKHLKKLLGHIPVRKLTPADVQRAVTKMREQGYVPSTISNRMAVLKGAVSRAMALGLINHDPLRGVRRPPVRRREHHTPDAQQLAAVLEEALRSSRYGVALLLVARTGLRAGEVMALRWSDVDWDAREIHVRATVIWDKAAQGAVIQPHPKSASSVRRVVLDDDTMRLLRQHRKRQAEERLRMGPRWQDHGLIFPRSDGRPACAQNLGNALRDACRRLGVPEFRVHDLRHAHASHLLAAGWSPVDVAERLGHSSPAVTMSIYAHAIPGRQRELVDKVGIGTKLAPNLGVESGES